jgi:hypothetical protein
MMYLPTSEEEEQTEVCTDADQKAARQAAIGSGEVGGHFRVSETSPRIGGQRI